MLYLADQLATAIEQRNAQNFSELIAILPFDEAEKIQELALILLKREKFVISFLSEADKEFLANKIDRNYWDENEQNSIGQIEVNVFDNSNK